MEAFRCFLNADESLEGLAISEIPMQAVTPEGKTIFTVQIGVLWDNLRTPAPSYHSPDQISHIMEEDYEDSDENSEENSETEEEKVIETAGQTL